MLSLSSRTWSQDDVSCLMPARQCLPRRPGFFIVGAPKAGTTAMHTYLSRHPQIFLAKKELHYFSDEVFYDPPLEQRDLAWYLDQFSEAGDKAVLGEASVWYLSSHIAAQRIKAFAPDAKILILVRNPVDLLPSYHSELRFWGYEDIEDLEEALAAEGARRKGRSIPERCPSPRVLYYSEITRFAAQIAYYFGLFGRNNVLVNVFDDLRIDPAAMYQRTLNFLGVDPTFLTTFEVINANKTIRSDLVRTLTVKPPKCLRGPVRRVFPKSVREPIGKWLWRVNIRSAARPAPNPAVIACLKHRFAGEVERLSHLLDRDLVAWCR